jgi:alpha-glucosidase
VLLYQGEELGLTEVELKREQLRDPVGDLYYPLFKGRDGCRTPMPWDAEAPHLGFTKGTPWLPAGPAHRALAVSRQENDVASTLNHARRFLALRKQSAAMRSGEMEFIAAGAQVLAFTRRHGKERVLCVFNMSRKSAEFRHVLLAGTVGSDWGCGETGLEAGCLRLGPLSAWFAHL